MKTVAAGMLMVVWLGGCASFDPSLGAVPESGSVPDAPYPRLADIPIPPEGRLTTARAAETRAMLDAAGVAALSRSDAVSAVPPVPEGFDTGARRGPDQRAPADTAALRDVSTVAQSRLQALPPRAVPDLIRPAPRALPPAPLTEEERARLLLAARRAPVDTVEAIDPLAGVTQPAPTGSPVAGGAISVRAIPTGSPVDAPSLLRAAEEARARARSLEAGL